MVWSCERIIPTVTLRLSGLKFTVVDWLKILIRTDRAPPKGIRLIKTKNENRITFFRRIKKKFCNADNIFLRCNLYMKNLDPYHYFTYKCNKLFNKQREAALNFLVEKHHCL
ncbi:hypothetical protein T08_8603 [Trichinella sp. T8]|nr:hypothetical protein T08_8603 [Trichinella sp. T8]